MLCSRANKPDALQVSFPHTAEATFGLECCDHTAGSLSTGEPYGDQWLKLWITVLWFDRIRVRMLGCPRFQDPLGVRHVPFG